MTSSGPTRTDIAEHVARAFVARPASRADLLDAARASAAPSQVLALIERLPADVRLRHLRDLWPLLPGIPVGA